MTKFSGIVPIIRSFDEAKMREFYLDFLGFEILFELRFEDDLPLYVGVKIDDVILHISEHFGDASPGSTVRIEVDDVHGYCKVLNEKSYKHARPGVQKQPWGYDEMSISDPFGNKLIFCEELKS